MAEQSPVAEVWIARGGYIALAIAIIYLQLLPLQTVPRNFAMPDFLLCLTLVWAARRPDYVPVLLIAAVFLLADFLFQRPPGLWTALVLILSEALRSRARSMRNLTFPLEWASVSIGVVAVFVIYRFVSAMTLLPEVPLVPFAVQLVMTVLAYPLVAVLSQVLLGVRRPAPGAVDSLGHRL